MRIIKLSSIIFAVSLFLTACGSDQTKQTATADPALSTQNDYWAKDNLDLQRVGNLLERSDNPQEFEEYLNEDDGINNLDLNGDGYADYISVDEFGDAGDYERGLSLYCRYGPDAVQEVATIVFYRDDLNYPGARLLLIGNEDIYGDNFYYETNWLDRSVALVSFLFSPRDVIYHSPYYYDNYPPDYVVYEVVETPVYRTRVEQLYPDPVVVYTTAPTFITKVKIKSPYSGQHFGQIRARLAKPTKEQAEFQRNNPQRAERMNADRSGEKSGRQAEAPKPEQPTREVRKAEAEKGGPPKPARAERAERPARVERSKVARVERRNINPPGPARIERPNIGQPSPGRVDRPNVSPPRPARVERPNPRPARVERPNARPAQVERPNPSPPRPARIERPNISAPKPNAGAPSPSAGAPAPANPGQSRGKGKKP